MNVKDFKYREYDIPRTEEINKYMAMSHEERERLMAEIMEKLRKQWALEDAKEQAGKNMKQAPQEVVALAKKHGYDTAEYWTSWKGYDIYSPDFTDDEIHCIGLPQVILVKNNKARMTKGEEGLNIINKIDR